MKVSKELLDSFRESRNQVTEFYEEQKHNRREGAKKATLTKRQKIGRASCRERV